MSNDELRVRGVRSWVWVVPMAAVLAVPAAIQGQRRGGAVAGEIDSLVAAALVQSEQEEREVLLHQADSLADHRIMAHPADADALYWRAVTAGLLAETAGAREKIRLGTRSMESAEAALAADSTHGGAHHVLGRIHAGVKRLGWFTRLIGGRLGMGPLLEAASWEDAEFHLRRARTLEPENITFRLEYGVTLRDMGRDRDAAVELAELLTRSAEAPLETAALDRACRILQELDAGPCPAR
ncbi:MAG: hypothetical protein HKN73_02805 [Gemmatimonadetes bacterium]|nr:hypothetical protein [Gemmatimonadota bacterium]